MSSKCLASDLIPAWSCLKSLPHIEKLALSPQTLTSSTIPCALSRYTLGRAILCCLGSSSDRRQHARSFSTLSRFMYGPRGIRSVSGLFAPVVSPPARRGQPRIVPRNRPTVLCHRKSHSSRGHSPENVPLKILQHNNVTPFRYHFETVS